MLLVLDDKHKEHLSFLTEVGEDVVREFCRISVEFIQKGVNPKVYQTAASKLGVDVDVVKNGVEGLMYLLSESSKLMLDEVDFADSIMTLAFEESLRELLVQLYVSHRQDIRMVLSQLSMDLPHYHNLQWRFDVQLASRSLRHQIDPVILLKLHIKDGDKEDIKVLQTDPVNLTHITKELETALQEIKSTHCRRILRNI